MKFVRILAILLILAAGSAQAGTMHPALKAMLDQAQPDEPISVIVNMRDQAPVATLTQELDYRHATPLERHRVIVEALQAAARSQDGLKTDLSVGVGRGSVLGYTGYWISNLVVVYALPAEIERIAVRPDVDFVEPNFQAELIKPVEMGFPPTDAPEDSPPTRGIGVTPGLRAINAPQVWYELGYTGIGRLIGSCDTGVDGNHPALHARWRGVNGQNPWQECWLDLLGNGTQYPVDNYGHGTHTTGTMAGLGAATEDTVGVAWGAQWIATNPIDQGVSQAFDQDIITAYQWFADPDGNPNTVDDLADVVQNSWGVNEDFPQTPPYVNCDSRWWTVIDNLEAVGTVVTWSAGNEGQDGAGSLRSPSDRATTLTNCFSVGAVDATNYNWPYPIAYFSSLGPSLCPVSPPQNIKPEVSAPGVDVYSSVPGGGYDGTWDGTSMAGPHVAGIVALIRQANPGLTVDQIKEILMDTSHDEGAGGEDNTFGHGFVDAYAAVLAATANFGHLEGHVYNRSWNNEPIPGAAVKLLETGIQWTTNAQGFYTGAAQAGTYTAQASIPGFQSQQFPVNLFSSQTTTQDFRLTDVAGPAITNVTQMGATLDSIGPYVVQATVNDLSTVVGVSLHYRVNFGAWVESPMSPLAGLYQSSIPGQAPQSRIDYFVQATDGIGNISVSPDGAPGISYSLYIMEVSYVYDAEAADAGWQLGMPGDDADAGIWVRADPVGTEWEGVPVQPEDDHTPTPGVTCFVTGNGTVGGAAGAADVDHGCTTLRGPIFDLSQTTAAAFSYWRWFGQNGNNVDDQFAVDVSSDGGATWVPAERASGNQNSWQKVTVLLNPLVTLTSQVTIRFHACDDGAQGLVEAAIDDFDLETYVESSASLAASDQVRGSLEQNRPNPFRSGASLTDISFQLSNTSDARVEIFDASGRLVRTLYQGTMTAGSHTLVWNGLDDSGSRVGAGVYFYRLRAGAYEQSRQMTVLR